jgi:hypothetical protein
MKGEWGKHWHFWSVLRQFCEPTKYKQLLGENYKLQFVSKQTLIKVRDLITNKSLNNLSNL